MNQRKCVWAKFAALLLAGPVWASAGPALAQTVIKIGVVDSYTGFLAGAGDEMDKGISLYVKTHQKDLPPGVTVELLKRDDTSAPDVGKRLAQELITRDQVNFIAGVVGSPIAAAIASVAGEAKTPFVITNAAGAGITRISPYVVRYSFTLWQQAYPLGQWTVKQGWKKGYTAVSDFIPGHDAEAAFTKGFTEGGGQVVNAITFPTSQQDFATIVQQIKDAKPDVAFIWVPAGPAATAVMKSVRDLKLREAGIKIVSTEDLVPDEELPNMGVTPVGLVTAGIYSAAASRPANKAFVAAWAKEYGPASSPDFVSADSWVGMDAIYQVIKQTGGKFDGDQALAILKAYNNPNTPKGPVSIDPDTRDVIQNVYMRRTEMVNGKLANVEFDVIPNVKDPWKEMNPPKPPQ
jgi:branched-chain amino acid transport system substrate-binding protein